MEQEQGRERQRNVVQIETVSGKLNEPEDLEFSPFQAYT